MLDLSQSWQMDLAALSVIYAMLERKKKFPVVLDNDEAFLEPLLGRMYSAGALEIRGEYYQVTDDGRKLRTRMVAMYDQAMQLEVFGAINLTLQMRDADRGSDDPNDERFDLVADDMFDPRFEEVAHSEDLRIAVMKFLAHEGGTGFDPRRVVFMQKLASGRFDSDDFWFRLRAGDLFSEIQQIVDSAYNWLSTGDGDVELSRARMTTIYRSGMIELRKREGTVCAHCKSPLAILKEQLGGDPLQACPVPTCGKSFRTQGSTFAEYECPNCQGPIYSRQRYCRGCGASIDRSMPAGSVETTTEVITTTYETPIWGCGYVEYGYVPVYYDWWDVGLAVDVFEPVWCVDIWVF